MGQTSTEQIHHSDTCFIAELQSVSISIQCGRLASLLGCLCSTDHSRRESRAKNSSLLSDIVLFWLVRLLISAAALFGSRQTDLAFPKPEGSHLNTKLHVTHRKQLLAATAWRCGRYRRSDNSTETNGEHKMTFNERKEAYWLKTDTKHAQKWSQWGTKWLKMDRNTKGLTTDTKWHLGDIKWLKETQKAVKL